MPTRDTRIHPDDLPFFAALGSAESLGAAGRELGVTTGAVSRRLAQLEARLGVTLINRTTRRMSLTPEGELLYASARQLLEDIDRIGQALGSAALAPMGLLRVNATLGFGRSHVAPLVSAFAAQNPQVEVRLQLSVNPPPASDDAYDVCLRFGAPPDQRIVARKLAPNRRLLCASPAYLARQGMPREPEDLVHHQCIGIRQGEEAYGLWRLQGRGRIAAVPVKTRGNLSTNDGGIAVQWALDGHGIVMRAEWDIRRYLDEGQLVPVLEGYRTPDADIYIVYPERHRESRRVRAFVAFAAKAFRGRTG